MQVCNLTTPGQLLPRAAPAVQAQLPQAAGGHDAEIAAPAQARGVARSPRWPRAAPSSPVLGEVDPIAPERGSARRALQRARSITICWPSGGRTKIDDVALLRLEQIYPFPAKTLTARAGALRQGRAGVVPGGAGEHGGLDLRRPAAGAGARGTRRPRHAAALCRAAPEAASTATGLAKVHAAEQAALVAPGIDASAEARGGRRAGMAGDMASEIKVPAARRERHLRHRRAMAEAGRRGGGDG